MLELSMRSASPLATKVAVGVAALASIPAVLHLLGAVYKKYHLLTSLPGPPARTLSAKGHEEELKEVKWEGWYRKGRHQMHEGEK
jgi:hypothetical protein